MILIKQNQIGLFSFIPVTAISVVSITGNRTRFVDINVTKLIIQQTFFIMFYYSRKGIIDLVRSIILWLTAFFILLKNVSFTENFASVLNK